MFHSFHFTIIFVCYSEDPKLSEKHNFISIAISGWSNHNLTGLYRDVDPSIKLVEEILWAVPIYSKTN